METIVDILKLTLLSMVPFVLASQGTMLAGRVGIFNVSVEGIMLMGASFGFLGAYRSGNLLAGMLTAFVVGMIFGLLFSYLTSTFGLNQFVIGLSFYFVGVGFSSLFYKLAIGVTLFPPLIPTLKNIAIPFLSKIPFIGEILFNQNVLVYFSLLITAALYYVFYKTSFGLKLRSVGEFPRAADALGINVNAYRYLGTVLGGGLVALGGAYLPMVYTGTFTDLMTNGRGWMVIALTFFGGWKPHTVLLGALFFAAVEVLSFRVQVVGTVIPYQLLISIPYIFTLILMAFGSQRSSTPQFLGKNYDRESRSH